MVVDGSSASDWPKSTFTVSWSFDSGVARVSKESLQTSIRLANRLELHQCKHSYLANECKSTHTLHKSINTVTMLMCDTLLHHFRKAKGCTTKG